jgi:hypothetical protein
VNKLNRLVVKLGFNEEKIFNISLIIAILYFSIRFIDDFFLFSGGVGDEWYFTNDLNYFIKYGYYNSVIRGISIPFTLICNVFYQFTNDISLSLRITGSLFTFILILYFMLRESLIIENKKTFFIYFLFLISTTGGSFYGTNDSIFFTSLIIFFHELLFVEEKSEYNNFILIFSATLLVMSRPVIIIYLTVFLISLVIFKIIKKDYNLKKILYKIFKVYLIAMTITLLFNFPKIFNKDYRLSYSTKTTTSEHYIANDINWVQWFYYSQLIHDQHGSGFFAPMVEWTDVRAYKEINGELNLPKSFSDYLINYKIFIVKRFPRSLIEVSILSIRYVGIFLILLPFTICYGLRRDGISQNLLLMFIILFGISSWSILMPFLVQQRHLYPYYVFLLFFYTSKTPMHSSFINIHTLNILIINGIIFWTLWKENLFYRI